MENFAQNYVKFYIFGTLLFKKGVNPKSLVAALVPAMFTFFLRLYLFSFILKMDHLLHLDHIFFHLLIFFFILILDHLFPLDNLFPHLPLFTNLSLSPLAPLHSQVVLGNVTELKSNLII